MQSVYIISWRYSLYDSNLFIWSLKSGNRRGCGPSLGHISIHFIFVKVEVDKTVIVVVADVYWRSSAILELHSGSAARLLPSTTLAKALDLL